MNIDLTVIIGIFLVQVATVLVAWLTHRSVNSRMEDMKKEVKEAAFAEGQKVQKLAHDSAEALIQKAAQTAAELVISKARKLK